MRPAIVFVVVSLVAARLAGDTGLWPLIRYVVDGPSMEPAYRQGDRVLVNRLAYVRRPPIAGDVVVIRDPQRAGHFLLKRIAAAVDPLDSSHAHYYVVGDNAGFSRDSRTFGPIARSLIVGKAWVRY